MDGSSSFRVAEISAQPEQHFDPLLDVEALHAPKAPCVLSFLVPELLPPGGEAIACFQNEGQVVPKDRSQRLGRIIDLSGDPSDLFKLAPQEPLDHNHGRVRNV